MASDGSSGDVVGVGSSGGAGPLCGAGTVDAEVLGEHGCRQLGRQGEHRAASSRPDWHPENLELAAQLLGGDVRTVLAAGEQPVGRFGCGPR